MIEKSGRCRLGRPAGGILSPDLPQAIEIAVMGEKDRVASGRREVRHVSDIAFVTDTADINVDGAVRGALEPVIAVGASWIWARDAAKAARDPGWRRRFVASSRQRCDAEGPEHRVIGVVIDFVVLQPARRRESDRIRERASGSRKCLRNVTVAAPVPIRIAKTVVARYLTNLALGHRDIGAMPSDEPVAVVHLIWSTPRIRAEIPVGIGNCQPALRIALVNG